MAKIIIIGGGVAGLSAGIYARLNGFDATVYEMHPVPGGNLTGWDREGFRIDNCVHWLTGTNPASGLYKIWKTLGAFGDRPPVTGKTLFSCEYGGKRLSLGTDIEKLRRDMYSVSPRDKAETDCFISAVKALQYMLGLGGKGKNEKCGMTETLLCLPMIAKYFFLTAGELSERFSHPLLKLFIKSLLTGHFGASALLLVFAHYCSGNAGLPEGGSRAMAQRMADRFVSLGGELSLGKKAVKVYEDGEKTVRARFSDGGEAVGDYAVLTADPRTVFGGLVDKKMPRSLLSKYKSRKYKRFSSFHCAFSCDSAELPFEGDLIVRLPERLKKLAFSDTLVLRAFPHKSGCSPEGKSLIQAMFFCPERVALGFIRARRDIKKYRKIKRRICFEIEKAVTGRFSRLDGSLKCVDSWTPATYKRFVGSQAGTYMSFAFSSGVLPVKAKNTVKGMKRVFLATQWLQPPGGLPIAAQSGIDAIKSIMKSKIKSRARF
ncbi:MAG: NAD(P)/FAD-dependent oxidoreductase [Clostridia bacterium]|nr:NAD(P)/FAD-dependent oxidoreductase [Clostridia bacterium]